MQVIYHLSQPHIAELHQLYQQAWWSNTRTFEETQQCVENSQICIGLVDTQQQLVAFARVLTDYTFKAFICDVIVAPSHRKRGLGDRIMSLIQQHHKLRHVKSFELFCVPEMFAFYQKHGFSHEVGDIKLMRKDNH